MTRRLCLKTFRIRKSSRQTPVAADADRAVCRKRKRKDEWAARPLEGREERDRSGGAAQVRMPVRGAMLRERIDTLVAAVDATTMEPDPRQLVRRYDDPLDAEVAG